MLGLCCCSSGMCHSSWADPPIPNSAPEKEAEPGNPWEIFTQESRQEQNWLFVTRNSSWFSSSRSLEIPFLSDALVEYLWDPTLGAPHAAGSDPFGGLRIGVQDPWDSSELQWDVSRFSIHQLIQDGKMGWKKRDFHPTWIYQGKFQPLSIK